MASNLAGGVCIGELNACVIRIAQLGADCHPTGGVDSGIVSAALVTMTASPDIEEGQVFEPKNGCGSIMYTYAQEDRVKRYNITGEMIFFDWEAMAMMFGGSTILGRAGGSFAGKVIGYADRLFNAAPRNGIYLEVIRQAVTPLGNDCAQTSSFNIVPAAVGHVFGKAKLVPGDLTFENDAARLTFQGQAENNAFLSNGPWNDYPGSTYAPNAPHFEVGYSTTEYNAILAVVGCGYQQLPAGS